LSIAHALEQPSPLTLFLSSQVSLGSTIPSPHTAALPPAPPAAPPAPPAAPPAPPAPPPPLPPLTCSPRQHPIPRASISAIALHLASAWASLPEGIMMEGIISSIVRGQQPGAGGAPRVTRGPPEAACRPSPRAHRRGSPCRPGRAD